MKAINQQDVKFMLARPEVGGQSLQRRCFVVSSFRNRDQVQEAVGRLRAADLFTYDFTLAEFTFGETAWNSTPYEDAQSHPEISSAARSDLTLLQSLGAPDFVLLVLPAGFSAGWETGYAAARGAHIVVCTQDSAQRDVPLLHSARFLSSLDECITYIIDAARPQLDEAL